MGDVVIGTCSWTDKTMVDAWYPSGHRSPEARLRYYAERFDTVEVDSTFYALPTRDNARRWAERTPDGFVFHIKAYGLMTQHTVDMRAMHPELEEYEYRLNERGRVTHPSSEMVDRAFEIFLDELAPLRTADKLGGVLMQFPPYFVATDHTRMMENLGYIEYAREQLGDVPMLVEFRHPSWVSDKNVGGTLGFLADRGIGFVSVDAPQLDSETTMPPITAATSPWSYVRFHGRNSEAWHARTATAADRFDHLYTRDELLEWEKPIRQLAEEADRTWVMFNNCKYDYAPRNAHDMALILGDVVAPRRSGLTAGEAPGDGEPGARSGGDDGPLGGQMDLGV